MEHFKSGIIAGAIIAIVLIAIAVFQMWPKWKTQGFIRGKTVEEREIVNQYWQRESPNIKKFNWVGTFGYSIFIILSWFIVRDKMGAAAVGFLIVFLPGYFLTCYVLDYLVRNNVIKF